MNKITLTEWHEIAWLLSHDAEPIDVFLTKDWRGSNINFEFEATPEITSELSRYKSNSEIKNLLETTKRVKKMAFHPKEFNIKNKDEKNENRSKQ